jgi:hypothetical protein
MAQLIWESNNRNRIAVLVKEFVTEVKRLINRLRRRNHDQGDALLIEKLLNVLPTIVSLLERKHGILLRAGIVLMGDGKRYQPFNQGSYDFGGRRAVFDQ